MNLATEDSGTESDTTTQSSVEPSAWDINLIEPKDSRIDLGKLWEKKIYAIRVLEAYDVFQLTMHCFFRYPVYLRRDPENGSFFLKFKAVSFFPVGFAITSFGLLILTTVYVISILGILVNFPVKNLHYNYTYVLTKATGNKVFKFTTHEIRAMEIYYFHRNLTSVFIILTCLLLASISSWCIYRRRLKIAAYYTYWFSAVETMKIHAGHHMKQFMQKMMYTYFAFLTTLLVIEICKISGLISGASGITATLFFRLIKDDVFLSEHFWFYKTVFGFILLYVLLASKCYMFLFIFTCKLLSNTLTVWTVRIDRALNKDGVDAPREFQFKQRLGLDLLFKDFVCILQLLDDADHVFAYTLETFYAANISSIIFEMYFIYEIITNGDQFTDQRWYDIVAMLMYAMHSFAILFMVTMAATDVSQRLLDAIDIVRARAVLRTRSDEEVYLIYSIYFSYIGTPNHGIRGAGMATINRPFIVGMVILTATFFIIILQFEPRLQMTDKVRLDRIKNTIDLTLFADWLEGFHMSPELTVTHTV